MTTTLIFTPRARRRLIEIARYIIRRFGPVQAHAYEDHLIKRVSMLAEGSPPYEQTFRWGLLMPETCASHLF
ncbi:MAG: type II toxin-antitoxin system RelE/ParE family toxin [Geminicoccaceae bacterium]